MSPQHHLKKHGFDGLPAFASYILTNDWAGVKKLAGVSEGWAIPAAYWQVPGGFDITAIPDRLDHHVIKWRCSGAQVHASQGGRRFRSDSMSRSTVCLQTAHSGDRYWASSTLTCMHLYVPKTFVGELADHCALPRREDDLRDDALFVSDRVLRGMVESYASRALADEGPPLALEMDARAVLIGLHLVNRYGASKARQTSRPVGALTRAQLREAISALCADLNNPPQLGQLARAAGVSVPHFVRAFAASTGLPPHRWLIRHRMDKAQTLMRHTRLSVLEVAAAVGYDDPSYFARAFRSATGKTPTVFRRSNLK